MNDRELLELAAKAAGYDVIDKDVVRSRIGKFKALTYTRNRNYWLGGRIWNPLTDDGDALRLAVKLCLHIEPWFDDEDVREVIVYGIGSHKEPDADDRMAATRRAIVRAAAEIGRAMT